MCSFVGPCCCGQNTFKSGDDERIDEVGEEESRSELMPDEYSEPVVLQIELDEMDGIAFCAAICC